MKMVMPMNEAIEHVKEVIFKLTPEDAKQKAVMTYYNFRANFVHMQ